MLGLSVSVILVAMPSRFSHTGLILSEWPDEAEQYPNVICDVSYEGQLMPVGISKAGCVCKCLCLHSCDSTIVAFCSEYGVAPGSVLSSAQK